jgi:hypothetical protein
VAKVIGDCDDDPAQLLPAMVRNPFCMAELLAGPEPRYGGPHAPTNDSWDWRVSERRVS